MARITEKLTDVEAALENLVAGVLIMDKDTSEKRGWTWYAVLGAEDQLRRSIRVLRTAIRARERKERRTACEAIAHVPYAKSSADGVFWCRRCGATWREGE